MFLKRKLTPLFNSSHILQPVHYLVVTATDGGRPSALSSSATATVLVQDAPDEAPVFERDVYEATAPENVPDYLVTTVR